MGVNGVFVEVLCANALAALLGAGLSVGGFAALAGARRVVLTLFLIGAVLLLDGLTGLTTEDLAAGLDDAFDAAAPFFEGLFTDFLATKTPLSFRR